MALSLPKRLFNCFRENKHLVSRHMHATNIRALKSIWSLHQTRKAFHAHLEHETKRNSN